MHGTATSKPRMLPMNSLSMSPNSTVASLDGTNEAVLGHTIWQTSFRLYAITVCHIAIARRNFSYLQVSQWVVRPKHAVVSMCSSIL